MKLKHPFRARIVATESIKKVIQDLVTALLSSKSTIRAVAVEQFGISGESSEVVITTTQVENLEKAGMDSSSFEPARILRILQLLVSKQRW